MINLILLILINLIPPILILVSQNPIKNIIHRNSASTVILAQVFDWDAMSNKTARSIDGVTESYSYDDLYRLESLDYDVVGNRDGSGYSVGAVGSSSKKMNRYAETPAGVTSHDVNGNLTGINANQKTLSYDYRNQMVLFNNGSDITTYKYDALGRRISKSNNSGETRYYSLGSRVIEETDDSNTSEATYVYGNYIDEVLSMNRGSNHYYYHSDDIYNVMALTDSVGGIAQTYDYDDFGKQTNTTINVTNPYLFNGREYDAESGFYNYRTRYMDPSVGRFTTRDTIGIWGDPSNIGNPYTYVGNNPQTFVDPYGEGGPILACILRYVSGGILGTGSGAGTDYGMQVGRNLIFGMPESVMVDSENDTWLYNETSEQWFWEYNIDTNSIQNSALFGGGLGLGGVALVEIGPFIQPAVRGGKKYLGFSDDALNTSDDAVRAFDDLDFPNNTGTPKSPTGGGKVDCNTCEDIIEKIHGHHTYPKALGGHPDQELFDILESLHTNKGGLHSDMAKFEGGWLRPSRGMTGQQIIGEYGEDAVIEGLRRFYSQDKYKHMFDTFENAVEFTRNQNKIK